MCILLILNHNYVAKLVAVKFIDIESQYLNVIQKPSLRTHIIRLRINCFPSNVPQGRINYDYRRHAKVVNIDSSLVDDCGGQQDVLVLMSSWDRGTSRFFSHAYNFLRFKGSVVPWANVVWELWSLPRYNFILWLAMLEKLRTRDRMRFLSSDTSCIFCDQMEENHGHLFFACSWSSLLWAKIKSWLHITWCMLTLRSAARRLHSSSKGLVARMKRVSLSLTVYLIWEE